MEKGLKKKNNPQKEAEKLQYNLRASFFYRKRLLFKRLIKEVEKIKGYGLKWEPLDRLGMSKTAWDHITSKNIEPVNLFVYPEAVKKGPRFHAYYRT